MEQTHSLRRDDGIRIEQENVGGGTSAVGQSPVDSCGETEVGPRIDVVGPAALGDGSNLGIRGVVHDDHRELAGQSIQACFEQLRCSEGHHDDLDA